MDREITEADYVSPNWNNAGWWDNFYREKLETGMAESFTERDPRHLLWVTGKFGFASPLKILDAGTGISYLSDLAVYMGHKVVRIDKSPFAVETCRTREVPVGKLAACLQYYFTTFYTKNGYYCCDRHTNERVDLVEKLLPMHREGGEILACEVQDLNDPHLPERFGLFDIVLNENGFRNGSDEFIRKSLHSFYRLLKPGGILIESNLNVLDRRKTIERMVEDAGFIRIDEWLFFNGASDNTLPAGKLQDKFAVCFWPTGC